MIELKAEEKQESRLKKIIYFGRKVKKMTHKISDEKRAILHQNALMKAIIYYAVTQKMQGTMEIMGWLAGKKDGDKIEIVDCYIGNCESETYYTELDPKETIKMRKQAAKDGLVLVGQWHCHPGMSTSPSGIDLDAMKTLHKFGLKNPVTLIVNDKDFYLGVLEESEKDLIFKKINNTGLKRLEFVIPEKTDEKIGLNLEYINGEKKSNFDWDFSYPIYEKTNMGFYPVENYISNEQGFLEKHIFKAIFGPIFGLVLGLNFYNWKKLLLTIIVCFLVGCIIDYYSQKYPMVKMSDYNIDDIGRN